MPVSQSPKEIYGLQQATKGEGARFLALSGSLKLPRPFAVQDLLFQGAEDFTANCFVGGQ